MIIFVSGKANSGKSLFAEEYLKKFQEVLYIGTLPVSSQFDSIINRHQARRPHGWGLYECCGDISIDLRQIQNYSKGYEAILFDGISFYLHRQMELFGTLLYKYKDYCSDLLIKAQNSQKEIIIVGQSTDKNMPVGYSEIIERVYESIAIHSQSIYYIDDGNVKKINSITENY